MDDGVFDAIGQAGDSGDHRVRIDFSGVVFMSSAMIDKLIRACKLANKSGIDLVIVNASPSVREVFTITRLGRLFTFDSE